jgi:hypothetical protein
MWIYEKQVVGKDGAQGVGFTKVTTDEYTHATTTFRFSYTVSNDYAMFLDSRKRNVQNELRGKEASFT